MIGCMCGLCRYGREVDSHLAQLAEPQRAFFVDMYERLCNAENDLDWEKAQARDTEARLAELLNARDGGGDGVDLGPLSADERMAHLLRDSGSGGNREDAPESAAEAEGPQSGGAEEQRIVPPLPSSPLNRRDVL